MLTANHQNIFGLLSGHPVKQADAVMLGYPLGLSMTPEVRKNDLEAYEPVTDPHGPAMTWVRHTGMFSNVFDSFVWQRNTEPTCF